LESGAGEPSNVAKSSVEEKPVPPKGQGSRRRGVVPQGDDPKSEEDSGKRSEEVAVENNKLKRRGRPASSRKRGH